MVQIIRKMSTGAPLLAVLLFFVPVAAVSAHPHIEVEVQSEVLVADGTITGVWATWTFDEIFSQLILADNDPAGTGKIGPAQVPGVKKTYFDFLRNSGFYSHFALGGKALTVPAAQKFDAWVDPRGKVVFHFFFPFQVKLGTWQTFGISYYDTEYYCDLKFTGPNPVVVNGPGSGQTEISFRPNQKEAYYAGYVTPVFAYVGWKPAG